MRSRKDDDKRYGKYPPPKTNGHNLRRALDWIVINDIFADMRLQLSVGIRKGTTLGGQWAPPERLRRELFDHSPDQAWPPTGLAPTSRLQG